MKTPGMTLSQAAMAVLTCADPHEKCRLTHELAAEWRDGRISSVGREAPPDRPARPQKPQLLPPKDMPRRAYGGERGRTSLIHALAHIELNAIDLAWDILCRFSHEPLPKAFYDDWVQVAVDEADHFLALEALLQPFGMVYGDLPAHDGLWQAAEKTSDDIMARLVVVPMTLEARGLDTTPPTLDRLRSNGDHLTPPVLDVIYHDEIRHVAAGVRWFRHMVAERHLDADQTYAQLMRERYPAGLKAPFNIAARDQADFPQSWYHGQMKGQSV